MVNFGPLTAEIGSGVWGTPTNFNGFCVLAALLQGIGRQPNFAALNRGRHLCSAGRPSGWALAHILVVYISMLGILTVNREVVSDGDMVDIVCCTEIDSEPRMHMCIGGARRSIITTVNSVTCR